jgi:hypothetical protein
MACVRFLRLPAEQREEEIEDKPGAVLMPAVPTSPDKANLLVRLCSFRMSRRRVVECHKANADEYDEHENSQRDDKPDAHVIGCIIGIAIPCRQRYATVW